MSGRVHVTVTIAQARWLASLDQGNFQNAVTMATAPVIESIARSARRALDWRARKETKE